MKRIIDESPNDPLHGRYLHSSLFVDDNDLKGKSVLDVGCGFGWFEADALRRGVGNIIGVEISEEDLVAAREGIIEQRAAFEVASAVDLPFEDGFFDTVVSWEVLEHIPQDTEREMFSEVARVLKSGGVFYLSTPYDSFLGKIFDPAWIPLKHRHYSIEGIEEFAAEAGMTVDEIRIIGGWGFVAWSFDMYFSKWVLRRKPVLGSFIFPWVDGEFYKDGGFTSVYARMVKT